jgi:YYY domain-containing protein
VDQTAGTPPRARTLPIILTPIILLLILGVALGLRLHGVNWDAGTDVHPDERFVGDTLVHNLTFPSSPFDLFNSNSGWNPAVASQDPGGVLIGGKVLHDPAGFNYGSLPLYLIFIFAHVMSWLGGFVPGWSSWQGAPSAPIHAGRVLSALADTVTVFLVYLIGVRLAGRVTGLFAAALATFAVLSIQLAHFTTVDILLTTFATGTLLASIDLFTNGRRRDYAIAGLWLAAALATKASAVTLVALVLVAHLWRRWREGNLFSWRTLWDLWPTLAACLPALFLFQPYTFVDWSDFWTGVKGQSDLADGNQIVFYTIKWHGTQPLIYPFQQLTNYSLGIPLALLAYAGVIYQVVRFFTPWRNAGALVAFFVISYFVSAGILYMKYLRYMEPIVPALCILAALLVSAMARNRGKLFGGAVRGAGLAIGTLVLVLTACYGLAYEHIYAEPLTRVQATCWMFQHIPDGTPIGQDTFDETLPWGNCSPTTRTATYPQAGSPQGIPGYGGPDIYATAQQTGMPGYGGPDTYATAQQIAGVLAQGRYYIISSRRGMDSVAAEPDQYPYYHRFYQLLLGSKQGTRDPLGYTLVKTFIVHPQLGPWTDTEQGANQNFDEYDHPPVYIFENTGHLDAAAMLNVLDEGGALAPSASALAPTTATPPKSLMLTPKQLAANLQGPSYGQMFPAGSLPMRLPIPIWWLMIEALGLLALPFSMRLFGRLRDCGFVMAKTVAILLLSWFAWILPSLGLAEYGRGEIALGLIPLAALSLLWGVRPRDVWPILRRRLRPILLTEGAFLLAFAAFVYIRALYPDMWHLISGGEKTMDFSFLNAIVRSRTLPPLDPWFSGGYLNYYYYGHFTVATLLKLAGIAPAIAINLAIPTFFALAVATCVSIGYSLLGRVSYAAIAGIFAMVSGNLYAATVLIGDLQAASPLHDQLHPVTTAGSDMPLLGGIIDVISGGWALFSGLVRGTLAVILGIWQVLLGHAQLPPVSFSSGWPWDQSRIIDNHTVITEYPFWTFLFADPHAHMWDVPFALCIVAIAFNFVAGGPAFASRSQDELDPVDGNEVAASRPLLPGGSLVVWPVIGAIVGAVGATNTWDLAIVLGALALAIGARSFWLGRGWLLTIIDVVWRMALVLIFAFGLYAPFYTHFQNFYGHIGWTILRHQTPIGDFLTHWGFFILLLVSYLTIAVLVDTNFGLWLRTRARCALFVMYYWDRRRELPRFFSLAQHATERNGVPVRFVDLSMPARAIVICAALLVLVFVVVQYAVLALLTPMIAAALLILVDRRQRHDTSTLFLHLLIMLGLGVAAAAEIVYIRDFYDNNNPADTAFRNNTVFKLYEEAWVLMGIASAGALARLLQPFLSHVPGAMAHALTPATGMVPARHERWRRVYGAARAGHGPGSWAWSWLAVAVLLFVGAELGPVRTTPIRVQARQDWPAAANAPVGLTLDGSAFIKYLYPGEYAAIQWINQTIHGAPVMLQSRWGNYRDFAARVTMFTGLPTVINWDWEDGQQRYNGQDAGNGMSYPNEITPRDMDVDTIYSTTDPVEALSLLHKYNVAFVYVGQFEKHGFADDYDPNNPDSIGHVGYPPAGIAKFAAMAAAGQLQLAYNHLDVQIYCVGRCPSYVKPVTH